MLYCKNDFEKELFDISVANLAKRYDPERRMVKGWRGANGYHSRLVNCEVHEIRASLELAYALLNRDAEGDRQIAYDILYRVLPLQDINPARKTYGIWAYYLEEDVERMNDAGVGHVAKDRAEAHRQQERRLHFLLDGQVDHDSANRPHDNHLRGKRSEIPKDLGHCVFPPFQNFPLWKRIRFIIIRFTLSYKI